MSITKMRKWMSKGADRYIMGGFAVLMALGMVSFFSGNGGGGRGAGNGGNGPAEGEKDPEIYSINGQSVKYADFQKFYSRSVDNYNNSPNNPNSGSLDTFQDLQFQKQALQTTVQVELLRQLAAKKGIKLSDNDMNKRVDKSINDKANEQLENQLKMITDQMTAALKPEQRKSPKLPQLIDEQINKKSKGQFKSVADIRAKMQSRIADQVKDPNVRDQAQLSVILDALTDQYSKEHPVSDADIMQRYEEMHIYRLVIPSAGKAGNQAEVQAKDVASKIKAGMKFDEAVSKFSVDSQLKTRKGELGWLTKESMNGSPDMKSLVNLPVGQISEPIKTHVTSPTVDDYVIFYIKEQRRSAAFKQAQFDKDKEKTRTELLKSKAMTSIQDDLKSNEAAAKISWNDPGFEALWRTMKELEGATPTTPEGIKKSANEILVLLNKHTLGRFVGILKFQVAARLQATAETPAEKTRLTNLMIDGLNAAINQRADSSLRLQLAHLYGQQKMNDKAKEQISKAVESVTGKDQTAEMMHSQAAAEYKAIGENALAAKEQKISSNIHKQLPKIPGMPGNLPPGVSRTPPRGVAAH